MDVRDDPKREYVTTRLYCQRGGWRDFGIILLIAVGGLVSVSGYVVMEMLVKGLGFNFSWGVPL
jgi:hypothetical protein